MLRRIWQSFGRLLNQSSGYANPAAWFIDFVNGGRATSSGLRITARSALTYSSLYQGVNLISGDVAKLPLQVYRRLPDGGKDQATKHPAWYLLRRKPCPEMTAFQFQKCLTHHALLRGNGYAYIYRDARYRPIEMVPLDPDCTWPIRVDGELGYLTRVVGENRRLDPADVLHIRGMGFDGVMGYSVVDMARESIGLGLAGEKFGATFFGNGSLAGGVLEYPGKLDEKIINQVRNSWEAMHRGLDRSHRVAVMESGTKFSKLSVDPEQAQFLQTRKFQRVEIASWLNLPPHKLGDDSRTSFASLEQENRSYLDSTLSPWLTTWEEECWDKLLTEQEKRDDAIVVEHQRLALLMADSAARSAFYHNGILDGWLSRNEVRDRENMNPVEGGDELLVPLNMGKNSDPQQPPEPPAPEPKPPGPRTPNPTEDVLAVHRELLVSTVARLVKREVAVVNQAARKPKEFLPTIDEFFAEQASRCVEQLVPVLRCLKPFGVVRDEDEAAERLVGGHVALVKEALLSVAGAATAETLVALVERETENWESTEPERLANQIIRAEIRYRAA